MYNCFVTPPTFRPRTRQTFLSDKAGARIVAGTFEQAQYVAYLAGNDADKVAAKLNIHKSFRTEQGIWILSKNKMKAAMRLGVDQFVPTQAEIDALDQPSEAVAAMEQP